MTLPKKPPKRQLSRRPSPFKRISAPGILTRRRQTAAVQASRRPAGRFRQTSRRARCPCSTIFSGDSPSRRIRSSNVAPSLHTVISPFTVIFMKASCGWPSTKKRPSRGTGVSGSGMMTLPYGSTNCIRFQGSGTNPLSAFDRLP